MKLTMEICKWLFCTTIIITIITNNFLSISATLSVAITICTTTLVLEEVFENQ